MNRSISFQCLLVATWFLGTMAVKFVLPILPGLADELQISATLAKYNISLFLFGKAAGMLFFGPLSERYGRKRFMLIGLSLYTIGNLMAFSAFNIESLLITRLLQGMGTSATLLMGRAMVNDLYKNNKAVVVFSHLFLMASVFISLLPILGSAISSHFPWRYTFLIMAAYSSVILLLCALFLKETYAPQERFGLSFGKLTTYYKSVLGHPLFLGYVLCSLFMVAGESAFNTAASFLLMKTFGLSKKVFGVLITSLALGHLVGTFICGRLAKHYSLVRMMGIGVSILALAGIAMVSWIQSGFVSIYSIMIPMLMFNIGTGFVTTIASVGVVGPFPKLISISLAASLLLKFSFSGLSSAVMSHLSTTTAMPISLLMAVCGISAFLSWYFLIHHHRRPAACPQDPARELIS